MLMAIVALALQAAAPPAAQQGCTAPQARQFDFSVGRWDVFPTGKTTLVAHSLIEKLYGGCAIGENWIPLKGSAGGSLSNFDEHDARWHQTWVDSNGSRVEFDGGLTGGKMVLLGYWRGLNGPGQDALVRMSYTRNADGSVRQLGEQSLDHGLSWAPSFDFTYKPITRRSETVDK
ncbi:hypothetical protein ACFQPG_09895 [Sphingomonas sp. GCM10030256]|uniref:hypothetical protein n=1 Tax=Sphingomonas sp. GCM10030256 TaxID=3273427 RepID=UPI0036089964